MAAGRTTERGMSGEYWCQVLHAIVASGDNEPPRACMMDPAISLFYAFRSADLIASAAQAQSQPPRLDNTIAARKWDVFRE